MANEHKVETKASVDSKVVETKKVAAVVPAGKKMWNDMKDLDIDVFAIVKKVSDYFEYAPIDNNKCYLTCKASAALPALETTLGKGYQVNVVEKYILVEKV